MQEGFRPKAVQVETTMAGSVLLMVSLSPRGGTPIHLDRADAYNIAIPLEPQASETQVIDPHCVQWSHLYCMTMLNIMT